MFLFGYSEFLKYASLFCRWHFEMPSMMEGSILIMSKAGTGTAMFSVGETIYILIFDTY